MTSVETSGEETVTEKVRMFCEANDIDTLQLDGAGKLMCLCASCGRTGKGRVDGAELWVVPDTPLPTSGEKLTYSTGTGDDGLIHYCNHCPGHTPLPTYCTYKHEHLKTCSVPPLPTSGDWENLKKLLPVIAPSYSGQEWEKKFNKEVPGYSMDIIGLSENRPIMVQREDALKFLQKAIQEAEKKGEAEGIRKVVELIPENAARMDLLKERILSTLNQKQQ
jgi:hypothetical protein